MPNLVLIAGMHRSGTSALTRAINLAGVPLPSRLLPPLPNDNPDGFWEPIDLVVIHEEILSVLKSGWNDPRGIPEAWFSGADAAPAREQLRAWIEKEIAGKEALLIKDPRLCRLLPLWRIVCREIGILPRIVIAFRNPVEVARSLKTRNEMAEIPVFFLWLRHVIDAERYSRDAPRSFVSFDQLMANGVATVQRIAADLSLTLPAEEGALRTALACALKPNLKHHAATADAINVAAAQMPVLLEICRWLQSAATGKTPPSEPLDEMFVRMRKWEEDRGIAIGT